MEITKDFIRAILFLRTVGEKDVEPIHKWIYAVNHDLALFCDDERYDNNADKFRDAVIELSTKFAKDYSVDDVITVAKYYELMKDWTLVEKIRKSSYDFNIFTCAAQTIDDLRECVVDYVYDSINENKEPYIKPRNYKMMDWCDMKKPDKSVILSRFINVWCVVLMRTNCAFIIPFRNESDAKSFCKTRVDMSHLPAIYYNDSYIMDNINNFDVYNLYKYDRAYDSYIITDKISSLYGCLFHCNIDTPQPPFIHTYLKNANLRER